MNKIFLNEKQLKILNEIAKDYSVTIFYRLGLDVYTEIRCERIICICENSADKAFNHFLKEFKQSQINAVKEIQKSIDTNTKLIEKANQTKSKLDKLTEEE